MLDVIVIVGTSLIFLFGWFLMKRLDRFLDENQRRMDETYEQREPEPCVHVNIVIYDSEQIFYPGNESDWTR